jgi:pantothenate kinase
VVKTFLDTTEDTADDPAEDPMDDHRFDGQNVVVVSSPKDFCDSAYRALVDVLGSAGSSVAPRGVRTIVGLCGTPGGGKSTLSEQLANEARDHEIAAVVVPMDGFHLANAELRRLGRADRKGAPDTFDVEGFVNLLQRIRSETTSTVWAPVFHREIEESYAGELAVTPEHRLIIVEGIHLLQTGHGWHRVLPLLDLAWYLECVDVAEQSARLVQRNIDNGRTPEQARAWVETVDLPNMKQIEATKHRAHTVFQLASW